MNELKRLHGLMITTSVIKSIIPASKIIDFCVSSNPPDLNYAKSVFDQIYQPSMYIWNSMIKGYCNSQNPTQALLHYEEMLKKGYTPDHFTFPFVLKVCSITAHYDYGKCLHNRISKTGFEINVYVSSCLLHMYVSCADMESALKMFDFMPERNNVVAWTSLIAGFVNNGKASEAIRLFRERENCNIKPNEITMVNVLVACARSRDIETGKWVHSRLGELGLDPFDQKLNFNVILATAIIDMYAKCGRLRTARELFDKMSERNSVAWNSMIGAYNQYGRAEEALDLFSDMRISGFVPDNATFFSLIRSSSNLSSLALGQSLHAYELKTGIGKDVAISTSIVDMYAKTGDSKSALKIFNDLETKDVMAWTSMILGQAMHGNGNEALKTFEKMQEDGTVSPDKITFIGVLCACSYLGLVEEGRKYFASMTEVYGIEPTIEHYGCMVDLLSRAGCFEEAENLIESMPMKPNVAVWSALINGCDIYENFSLANKVRCHITQLEPHSSSGVYVLLSNIYAKASKWPEAKLARTMLNRRRIGKTLGQSSIEIKSC